jgi:prevent-host-death family protein
VETISISATEAKNEFGRVLESVMRGEVVVITRHEAPKAVLMSVEEFNALSQAPRAALGALSAEFDALLAGLQAARARAGLRAAFDASPKDMGNAARRAARRRD